MEKKKYVGCEKVLAMYPAWEICGKPVLANNTLPRCSEHPIKRIWPSDVEEVGTENVVSEKPSAVVA